MARQRIRVTGSDARLVAMIAVLAGLIAAGAGGSPTGATALDVVVVTAVGGGAIWAAASAPWWAGVSAAAIATAFAPSAPLLLLGATAVIGGMAIGLARRTLPWSRALVAAVALQVFARLGNIERFGFTALLGIVTMLALAVLGLRRRPRRERRVLWLTLVALGAGAVVAALGLGVAAAMAKNDFRDGVNAAEAGIDLLADGELVQARSEFERAAVLLGSAENDLDAPWTQPSRLLPVAAQHRHSAVSLVKGAGDLSTTIADVLAVVDYDSLRVVNGRIDIAAIEAVEQPLQNLNAALASLESAVSDARSPWLLDAIDTRLDDLVVDIDKQQVKGDNALVAIQQAPAMLGRDGPRRYFLSFTTPAEARGLGGFMGNWAEVTADEGKLTLSDFGRTGELNAASEGKTLESVSDGFVDVYAGFLFTDTETRTLGRSVWSNMTASPDFPAVAGAMSELYTKASGRKVDGVVVMDVYAIAKLMEITGPIPIEGSDIIVNPETAAQFLLTDQYSIDDKVDRVDLLEEVALTTVERLLTTTLPSPPDLADLMGPMARQGRFVGWSAIAEEQDVFRRINMSGALPLRDGGDGIAVSLNNAAANKIDYYLDGELSYDVTIQSDTRAVQAELQLTLVNSSPTTGRPDYVIGNTVGLPLGTNSFYVSVHHALTAIAATVDGEPVAFQVGVEGEYFVSSTLLEIPAGATKVVTITLIGQIESDADYRLAVRSPPMVRPLPISVSVDGEPADGSPIADPGVVRFRVPVG